MSTMTQTGTCRRWLIFPRACEPPAETEDGRQREAEAALAAQRREAIADAARTAIFTEFLLGGGGRYL
jgi:hypothetical protein